MAYSFYPTKRPGRLGDAERVDGQPLHGRPLRPSRRRTPREPCQPDRRGESRSTRSGQVLREVLSRSRDWTEQRRSSPSRRRTVSRFPGIRIVRQRPGLVYISSSPHAAAPRLQHYLASRGIGTAGHYPVRSPGACVPGLRPEARRSASMRRGRAGKFLAPIVDRHARERRSRGGRPGARFSSSKSKNLDFVVLHSSIFLSIVSQRFRKGDRSMYAGKRVLVTVAWALLAATWRSAWLSWVPWSPSSMPPSQAAEPMNSTSSP